MVVAAFPVETYGHLSVTDCAPRGLSVAVCPGRKPDTWFETAVCRARFAQSVKLVYFVHFGVEMSVGLGGAHHLSGLVMSASISWITSPLASADGHVCPLAVTSCFHSLPTQSLPRRACGCPPWCDWWVPRCNPCLRPCRHEHVHQRGLVFHIINVSEPHATDALTATETPPVPQAGWAMHFWSLISPGSFRASRRRLPPPSHYFRRAITHCLHFGPPFSFPQNIILGVDRIFAEQAEWMSARISRFVEVQMLWYRQQPVRIVCDISQMKRAPVSCNLSLRSPWQGSPPAEGSDLLPIISALQHPLKQASPMPSALTPHCQMIHQLPSPAHH